MSSATCSLNGFSFSYNSSGGISLWGSGFPHQPGSRFDRGPPGRLVGIGGPGGVVAGIRRRRLDLVEIDVPVLAPLVLVVLDPYASTFQPLGLIPDRFAEGRIFVAFRVAHHVAQVASARLEGAHLVERDQVLHGHLPVPEIAPFAQVGASSLARARDIGGRTTPLDTDEAAVRKGLARPLRISSRSSWVSWEWAATPSPGPQPDSDLRGPGHAMRLSIPKPKLARSRSQHAGRGGLSVPLRPAAWARPASCG
jgi:hypothetical protein